MTPTSANPFSFRYANFYNLAAEYAPSDRDQRQPIQLLYVCETASRFSGDIRMQAHSAQPYNRCRKSAGGPVARPVASQIQNFAS